MNLENLDQWLAEALRINSTNPKEMAWRNGDITAILHSGQVKIDHIFETSPHQIQVVLCARGFGKTFWGAAKASSIAIKKPKAKIKIATEFQTDLESLIIPNFEAALDSCPDDIRPKWMPSKSRYLTDTGSEISLIGLDRKPNGLRGQHKIDMIILEEAGFISKLATIFRSVLVPITTHSPDCKIVLISTPPESLDHEFWSFVDRAEQEGALTVLTIDDNPMLSKADIERIEKEMGGRNSVQFRREYLCERIMDTTKAIIPEWPDVKARTVCKAIPMPPFYKPMVAIDLALNDNLGVVFGYWDFPRAKAVIQAELLLNGVNSKELVEKCLHIERSLWGDITPMRWADGSLYTLNDLSSVHKYAVSMVHKDHVEAQVNSLRLMLQTGTVEIQEQCKSTISQCASGVWNKSKTEFARHGTNHQDLLAALIYFVRHINKENPFPKDYLYNRDTMHYRPGRNMQPHHEQLKKAFGPKKIG
jgi:hypothetical protein